MSGGCDVVWKINKRIDDGLRSKGAAAAQGVIGELEPFLDQLIDEDFKRALDGVNSLAGVQFDRASVLIRDVEKAVDRIFVGADDFLQKVDKTYRYSILNATELSVEAILDRADKTIDKIDCIGKGNAQIFATYVRELVTISWLRSFFDSCYKDHPAEANEYFKIYEREDLYRSKSH